MFSKEFTVTVDVLDPISFCQDKENNVLILLKRQYVGRCYQNSRIIQIVKLNRLSPCIFNRSGLNAAATINVQFEAMVDIFSSGDILCPVEINTKETMVIGFYKKGQSHAVVQINLVPEFASIKIKQYVPILLDRTLHDYMDTKIMCSGRILTSNNNPFPVYGWETTDKEAISKIFDDQVIAGLLESIMKTLGERDQLPKDIRSFFEKLYEGESGSSEFKTGDILEMIKTRNIPSHMNAWTRRSSRYTTLVEFRESKTPDFTKAKPTVIFRIILNDILNYVKLINSLAQTFNNKSAIASHSNLWVGIKKEAAKMTIGGSDEEDSGVASYEQTSDKSYKFSKDILDAAKKFNVEQIKWDSVRITRDTPQYSLMPWHIMSHNLAVDDFIGKGDIDVIYDLTAHVGIDSINLASQFTGAKLVGVEINPEICKLYKCNLALIPNKYEAICGNGIDVIKSIDPNIAAKTLVYLDPPWGGTEYKSRENVELELVDSHGEKWSMEKVVEYIFAKGIAYHVLLKAPTNYRLNESEIKAKKYEVKNETSLGKFGRTSYMLYGFSRSAVPSPGNDQFKFINQHPQLRRQFNKLIEKYVRDLGKVNLQLDSDKDVYSTICKLVSTGNNFGKSRGSKRYNDIKDWIPKNKGAIGAFLDIGAGGGDITVEIAKNLGLDEKHTYAVDIEGKAVPGVTFQLTKPGEKLDIESKTITLITAFQSLHHFQDLTYKLEEVTRVATDTCTFIIREHDADIDSYYKVLIDIEHLLYMICFEGRSFEQAIIDYYAYYRTRKQWNTIIEKLGWKQLTYKYVGGPTNYYYSVYKRSG